MRKFYFIFLFWSNSSIIIITKVFFDKIKTQKPKQQNLKNAKNEAYLWTLKQTKKNTYEVQQVFVNKLKAYQGEALIENNQEITDGMLIIAGGARGITKKDLVRIK